MRISHRIAAVGGLVAVAALAGPTPTASAVCPINRPITSDLGVGFCYQTNPACAVLYTETPVTGRVDVGTSCT